MSATPSSSKPKPSVPKRIARTLCLCCAIYLLICVGCASCQRRMIYFPPAYDLQQTDALAHRENLERWNNDAGTPIGWKRLSPTQPSQGQVLITHGNGGCAFQLAHYPDAIQAAAPLDVFIVEYPGYADRPGKPTEQTIYEAADDALKSLPTNTPLYLVGESLGTGVACYLAGHHPGVVSGIALLAPYNCLADVGQAHMKILPVSLILCDKYPSEKYLKEFHGPVAAVVGGRDTVVPQKFGRRLLDSYSGPKKLWESPEADHNNLMYQSPEVWKQIIDFWLATTH